MNSPGNQPPLAPDDSLLRAIGGADISAERPENKEVRRVAHPQEEGASVIPSGNFPVRPTSDLPPPRAAASPTRADARSDDTEIISALPDPAAASRRRKARNRKTQSPLKLLGMFAAVQLMVGILFFALFGGLIRNWLQDTAVAPDGVTAKEAGELRNHVLAAEAEFESFDADLANVKKQLSVTPGDAWAQLEVLGARNELTLLADAAITNGDRAAYDQLLAKSKEVGADPRLKNGALAEISRVKTFYASGTRLGSYALPVATLYPSEKSKSEEALSSSQLIRLLGDQEKSWRVRTRAAYLLGSRRNLAVAEALVRAAKEDPNLDVVKECVFTFEENTGYRARGLFEIESLVSWWKSYESRVGARAETTGAEDPS